MLVIHLYPACFLFALSSFSAVQLPLLPASFQLVGILMKVYKHAPTKPPVPLPLTGGSAGADRQKLEHIQTWPTLRIFGISSLNRTEQQIMDKVKLLPGHLKNEVLDFLGYLLKLALWTSFPQALSLWVF